MSISSAASSTCRRRSSGWNTIRTARAFIALVKYQDGELAYILAPQRLRAGDTVVAGQRVDIKPGNAMPLAAIPVGTIIHNIEMKAGAGGKIARSAGTYAQLVGKDAGYAQIKLMSGELRVVRAECMASIGAVSNPDNMNQKIGKAGRTRWLGKRPHNRGVVMNPVDHPLGGGEGRSSGGRHPVSPWGQPTKGYKTRGNKRHRQADHPPPQQGQVRWHVPSGRVRSSTAICCNKAEAVARIGPQRDHQDLVAPLDDPAAVRRPDLRRLQRPQVPAGAGEREHGRPQVRRVLADPHLHRPLRRQEGEAGLT